MSSANAERTGVTEWSDFRHQAISDLTPPDGPPGLVIVNPPYGVRLGNPKRLNPLYQSLGQVLSERFKSWRVGVITASGGLAKATGLPSKFWIMQGIVYVLFAVSIGAFSAWPTYHFASADAAQIKMSVSHPGQRKEACRRRTAAELEALAPNMRSKMSCTRERWPVELELIVDGKTIFAGTSEPAGLRNDGASSFYEKVRLKAGVHTLSVRLRDGGPNSEYTYEVTQEVTLAPAQNLIIAFREDGTGLYLK